MGVKILLTGGTGFIGRWLLDEVLKSTDWEVMSLERLPGGGDRGPRVTPVYHDLLAPLPERVLNILQDVAYIVHAGAVVSGARSLVDPEVTVRTSVLGTYHLLEAACRLKPARFIFVSTGEVVGAAPPEQFLDEEAPLRPSNPYSAGKAAAEMLVRSYHRSFGVPTVTVRSMNLFGGRQDLRRFVPQVIRAILAAEPVCCHVGPDGRTGSRNWLHVDYFTQALLSLIESSNIGEVYHVVGPERDNDQIIWSLERALGRKCRINRVVPGPSHDLRYALTSNKLFTSYQAGFEESIARTARWYANHREWLDGHTA